MGGGSGRGTGRGTGRGRRGAMDPPLTSLITAASAMCFDM